MKIQDINNIYIISLKNRRHRLDHLFKSLPTSISSSNHIYIYDAVIGHEQELPEWWTGNAGAYGCYMSHINLWKIIVDANLYNTLILEDDAIFCDNFTYKFNNCMDLLPSDWDQVYIGGQHLKKPDALLDNLVIANNINRTHAYIINSKQSAIKILKFLDDPNFWIKQMSIKTMHVDHALGKLHENKHIITYACKPFLIGQNTDRFSDTGGSPAKKQRWWNR